VQHSTKIPTFSFCFEACLSRVNPGYITSPREKLFGLLLLQFFTGCFPSCHLTGNQPYAQQLWRQEALALPVREFGTVCHVACKHLTSATNILKRY